MPSQLDIQELIFRIVVEAGRPLPQIRLAWQPTPNLPIDQPRHGTRPCGVVLTMMPIHLAQTLIAPHPSNRVLHLNPSSREGPIEAHVFGRTVFPTRLAARGGAQVLWMRLGNADI